MKCIIFLVLGTVLCSTGASAYCSKPSQSIDFPDGPGSYDRPSVPFCLSGYKFSGTHTCEDYELTSYQSDIEEYIGKLNKYIRDNNDAAEEAAAYALAVAKYAQCEADEASSQHK
ncbi:hypothetical protein V9K92_06330 [Phyllobacterium sp. CCNWLW109]|uniref:hypothetical protein n=1 Tax=Phyllobacterium sp. CCNWLW109 TaxID=3127479 RepID=UPI0030786CE0